MPFGYDEMRNLDTHWRPGLARLAVAPLLGWLGAYRPMGGWFYVALYEWFGLNPVPFHVAALLILLVNVYLFYCFARVLGCSEPAGALVVLLACYHAGLANLFYDTAQIYDILCGSFYLAAFVYYARARRDGRVLRLRDYAVFLALCLAALNSKEMAATLPLLVLLYEWLYHGRPRWNGSARPALLAALLTAVFLYGRAFGPDGLTRSAGYQPVFSMHRVWEFHIHALSDLFCVYGFFSRPTVVAVWLVTAYLAWRRDRPALRFCWLWMVLTPLPLEFLLDRGQASLYVMLPGWAVFTSVVFLDLSRALARLLAAEPLFRRAGEAALFAALAAGGAGWWSWRQFTLQRDMVRPQMAEAGRETRRVIEQLRDLNPKVRPRSMVVFLSDPFQEFDMFFIADLWFHDRSLDIRLNRQTPLSPQDLAKADYVFDFRGGKLITVAAPADR